MTDQKTAFDIAGRTNDCQFVRVAPLYDQLMHDVPYARWMTYLQELLSERNCRPRLVLDLACGTGNVSELLTGAGYSVIGVDIAEDMIIEARKKAAERELKIQYCVQDAAELDLPGRRFDLCVSLFDSLNYVTRPDRLQSAFERIFAHLSHNGIIVFDMNSEFALMNHFFDQSNRATDSRLRYDWKSEYFSDSRLCRIEMRFWYTQDSGAESQFSEEHWQFAYREAEVVSMLAEAGFEDMKAYQAYTMRPTTRTSDRIFYIARKP